MSKLTGEKFYEKFSEIEVGDLVYTECYSGLGSGGAVYDIGEKVTKLDETTIYTDSGTYCVKSGDALSPPIMYYIGYWRKK